MNIARGLAILLVSATLTRAQSAPQLRMVPQPRELRVDREVVLTRGLNVLTPKDADDAFATVDLRESLREFGVPVAGANASAKVTLLRLESAAAKSALAKANISFDDAMREQGYVI